MKLFTVTITVITRAVAFFPFEIESCKDLLKEKYEFHLTVQRYGVFTHEDGSLNESSTTYDEFKVCGSVV